MPPAQARRDFIIRFQNLPVHRSLLQRRKRDTYHRKKSLPGIVDHRLDGTDLVVKLDPGVPADTLREWKEGESIVFDLTLDFNRKVSIDIHHPGKASMN